MSKQRWGTLLLPWLAAAIAISVLKFSLLHRSGFLQTALLSGSLHKLSPVAALGLFRNDLLLLFAAVPAVIVLIAGRARTRVALWGISLGAVLLTLLVAIQVHVWDATGSFTSLRMTYMLLAWEAASRDRAFLAIRPQVWIAVGGLLGFVAASSFIAFAALARRARWLERTTLAVFAVSIAAGVIAWVPRLPATPWTSSLLGDAFYSFFLQSMSDSWHAQRLQSEGAARLLADYRSQARIPSPERSLYFGKARGANVLIFTMESMSADALDPAQDALSDMPNLRQLRDRAFVMSRHYTSFPQTDYALFSMMTSLYARCFLKCSGSEITQRGGPAVPSLMRVLDSSGYRTGFYGYIWKIPQQRDDLLLASLGFENLSGPPINSKQDREGLTTFFGPVSYTAGHDLQSLDALCGDIRHWSSAHQRFAAMYFPEIGHDPYRALDGDAASPSMARGRELAVLQDHWLGRILNELDKDGILNNTIIVVTGDHGMRFTATLSDGSRELTAGGKLDDRVMRVPMLIYVPQALDHTVRIQNPTSHIDLMPTLLDLLGLTTELNDEQGSPMMDPRIAQRRLYLSMGEYGASGYYESGSYFMVTGNGIVYRSPTMQFDDRKILAYDSKASVTVRDIEREQNMSQAALLGDLLHESY
ncbi:MAG: LTA synthase family protein [Acidobacteriota bacterium]